MVRIETRVPAQLPVFTSKKHRGIIIYLGSRCRFPVRRGYIVPINANSLTLLLDDYFPDLDFFESFTDNLDILTYVENKGGTWTLNLNRMSNSEAYGHLFHEDFPALWNEAEAGKRYGRADVIRYFIDMENDRCWSEFSKLSNASQVSVIKDTLPQKFLDELDYGERPVSEGWDFSKLVKHRPKNNIYKALLYYLHRYYTLLGFGLDKLYKEDPGKLKTSDADKLTAALLSAGSRRLEDAIKEQIPETGDFIIEGRNPKVNGINHWTKFLEIEQEVLESVQTGGSIYKPKEMDDLISQLRSRIPDVYKGTSDGSGERTRGGLIILNDNENIYDPTDIKNINNHMEKAGKHLIDPIDYAKYCELKQAGSYREKVRFLYNAIMGPLIIDNYSEQELDIIQGLFFKQFPVISIDKPIKKDGETDESFSVADTITDKHIPPVIEYFKEQFKDDLVEEKMTEFLKYVSWYLDFYQSEKDSGGILTIMTDYYKRKLFSEFCKQAGITESTELRRHFIERIQIIIDNHNANRSKP
jgi:hypothetical protein